MFFRLLLESFRRQRRQKLLAGAAILFGTTAVTSMLALATTIGDRIHAELAVYGANIVMTPESSTLAVKIGDVDLHPSTGNSYLHSSDLPKLRTIFWANNITAISPELRVTGDAALLRGETTPVNLLGLWFDHDLQGLHTGAPKLHPLWKLTGHWPSANPTGGPTPAVVGASLAKQLRLNIGDRIPLAFPDTGNGPASTLQVTGIVSTGDSTDNTILVPLAVAEALNHTPDAVSRVEVSARTRPEDSFARKDPDTLSPKQRDLWYCRPYANSISYQIHEAIPSAHVSQLRQVEQNEGAILSRISGLLWLVSAAALLAAAFAVSAAMATAILERRSEIGLMRSLGASRASIALLFFTETGLLALLAGTGGYLAGSLLAHLLGTQIFAADPAALATHLPTFNPVLLPIVLSIAVAVALAGSTPSIRSALRTDPSEVLRANV